MSLPSVVVTYSLGISASGELSLAEADYMLDEFSFSYCKQYSPWLNFYGEII